jgi:hypothetical protein
LQLREGCAPEQVTQQTPRGESCVLDDAKKQGVVCSIHDVPHHVPRYPEQKPIEGLPPRCFFYPRQYGQLAEDCAGFGERRRLPAYAHNGEHRAPTQHVDSPLCVRWALVAESVQFGYDASSFVEARLTNLREHFRNCLQSSALRFREFQSKFLPFRSPVTGL